MTSETATTMVGPYRLEGLLGRGGMGEVFRAYDTRRQRVVALKLLPEALSSDDDYRERFRRESLAAASLVSPHVVPIHDFGEVEGRLFIDMRLIEGADLARSLDGRPMDPGRAVNVLLQLCDALADAHARGVVHRDVKPSNVLLTDNDFAYLVDFGIATTASADTPLTATGYTVGTFGYMAPERFEGTAADPRSDIYSLGCLLHELLTGRRPFAEHNSTPSLIRAHLMLEPDAPSAAGVTVPPELDHITLRAMAKEPGQRFAGVHDMVRALRAVPGMPVSAAATPSKLTSFAGASAVPLQRQISTHVGADVPEPPTGPVRVPTSRPQRRRMVVAFLAAVGVVLLAAGGIGGAVLAGGATTTTGPATTAGPTTARPFVLPTWTAPTGSAQPSSASFGETLSLGDGLTATAAAPRAFQPQYQTPRPGVTRYVRVDITLTNNTNHYVNFGEQFMPTLKIDGVRTTPMIDLSNGGVGGVQLEAVPPGQSTTDAVGYALTDQTTPIELTISPMSIIGTGGTATWTGNA